MQRRFRSPVRSIAAVMVLFMTMAAASPVRAELKLPNVIGPHMVLQQKMPVAVWGWDDPNQKVTVEFAGQSKTATADAHGKWMLRLDAMDASDKPRTMKITGSSSKSLDDILVGEVWLCSGQSNMEFKLNRAETGQQAIAAANYPTMRLYNVAGHITSEHPNEDAPGKWEACTPQVVGSFTAVGFFFGRDLMNHLHVPIGLVESDWGGTVAEAWTRYGALAANEHVKPLIDDWAQRAAGYKPAEAQKAYEKQMEQWKKQAAKAKAEHKRAPRQPRRPEKTQLNNRYPASIYNGMLAPIIPYTIRGAIWYQGESNESRAYEYRFIFSTLIKSWRDDWNQPVNHDFSFYFVQIAPFTYGAEDRSKPQYLPELWDSQNFVYKTVPHTGFAVPNDVATIHNIHPTKKQPVGERLARWALVKDYGKGEVFAGPIYDSAAFEAGKAVVHFESNTADGLKTRDGKAPSDFEIAGADKKFHPATAKIEGQTVVVWSDEVKQPKAVRFAWFNVAEPNLINSAGLPAGCFRSDDWPLLTADRH